MNDKSDFDADAFMQQNVDAPLATERELCPEGFYKAMIGDFDSTAFQKFDFEYKKGPNAGQPGSMTKFSCPFSILDPTVLAKMERDTVVVFRDITIDRNPDGTIATGKDKNVDLGQTRQAVGQNNAGGWGFSNLKGAGPCMVQVKHTQFERRDGTKGMQARVVRCAPITG